MKLDYQQVGLPEYVRGKRKKKYVGYVTFLNEKVMYIDDISCLFFLFPIICIFYISLRGKYNSKQYKI